MMKIKLALLGTIALLLVTSQGAQAATNTSPFPATGPVGIGTTNPPLTLKLDIVSSSGPPATSGTTPTVSTSFRLDDSSNAVLDFGGSGGAGYWLQCTDKVGGFTYHYPILLNPNGGNVGIGTTNPLYPLDVKTGTDQRFFIRAPYSGQNGITLQSGNDAGTSFNSFTIESSQLLINAATGGKVGIATTTPENKLHVSGAIESSGARNTPAGNGVTLSSESTYDAVQSWNGRSLSINGMGNNVGIGTTNPQRKLDISATGQLTFGDDVSQNYSQGVFWNSSSGYGIFRTPGTWVSPSYQQLLMTFATGVIIDGGSMYGKSGTVIQPNGGNVGIGTSSPAAKLDISQSWIDYTTSFMRLTNTSPTGQTPLDFYINGTLRAKVRADYVGNLNLVANGGGFNFVTGGEPGGTNQMNISNAGVVVPGAISANSFSGNGSALSSLNASNLSTGQVPLARLGSGSPNPSTFLRGDGQWQPATATVSPAGTTGQLQYNNAGVLGAVPSGSTTQVYHGNATGVGSFGAVNLNSDVSGILSIPQGGTGQTTATGALGALSPLGTKGDLLAFSTGNNRLPIGTTNGQILTVDSTQPFGMKWAAPSLPQSNAFIIDANHNIISSMDGSSLSNATGAYNYACGVGALLHNTSGSNNYANGTSAMMNNFVGSDNIASGAYALYSDQMGIQNVAIGTNALYNSYGSCNVAIGTSAGRYEIGSNAFYIDNQDRGDTNGDKTGALLYGTFDPNPTNQTLVANAAFSAKSISGSGTGITGLNASNLTIGTVASARLGSGTATASTFLRGDGTWQPVASVPTGTSGALQFNNAGALGAVSLGTVTQVYHGNAAGVGSFGAVALTTDVTGVLSSTNGGTGNGFTKFSGPTTVERVFTLPDASSTIMVNGAAAGGDMSGSYPNPTINHLGAISGANLTNLDATHLTGTVAPANLGSGADISMKFLRGDSTWQTITATGGGVTSVNTGDGLTGGPITTAGTIDLKLATVSGLSKSPAGLAVAGVVNSMIDAAASIDGSKISPDFGTQNVKTTGTLSAGNTSVNGNLKCHDLTVTADALPDYVFDSNYKLEDLKSLEMHIKALHHLPGVQSADQAAKNGMSVPVMVSKQLEKIEELTLYVIKLNKEQESMKQREESLMKLCQDLIKQNQALNTRLESSKQ